MRDNYNREIDYMRISITDRCNLRCQYCMPNGIQMVDMQEILTYEEILAVVRASVTLGIHHIKITGGEPLVRKDCTKLIASIKSVPGIDKVTITTNGLLLKEQLSSLMNAGIDGINVSLDTMDRNCYQKITGRDEFNHVLEAIQLANTYDVSVKINAVSADFFRLNRIPSLVSSTTRRGIPKDWKNLIQLTKDSAVDVRFIEMMPIGLGKNFPSISHDAVLTALKREYPGLEKEEQLHGFGPAVYYRIPGHLGCVGLISAIHGKFCDSCNRIRLTSKGYLKTCLCYEDGVDLQSILRSNDSKEEIEQQLIKAMRQAIWRKPKAHCFETPDQITEQKAMASIGG